LDAPTYEAGPRFRLKPYFAGVASAPNRSAVRQVRAGALDRSHPSGYANAYFSDVALADIGKPCPGFDQPLRAAV
jgi:hypothetical protein